VSQDYGTRWRLLLRSRQARRRRESDERDAEPRTVIQILETAEWLQAQVPHDICILIFIEDVKG